MRHRAFNEHHLVAASLVTVFIGVIVAGCDKPDNKTTPAQQTPQQQQRVGSAASTPQPSAATETLAEELPAKRLLRSSPSGKVDLVTGVAGGPAAPAIADEVALGAAADRRSLVYVGAPWCEPCKRFKKALLKGDLDAQLAGVRFVEFDADRDIGKLANAGYTWSLVPFFAAPKFDGTYSGHSASGVPAKDSPMLPLAKRVAAILTAASVTAASRDEIAL